MSSFRMSRAAAELQPLVVHQQVYETNVWPRPNYVRLSARPLNNLWSGRAEFRPGTAMMEPINPSV